AWTPGADSNRRKRICSPPHRRSDTRCWSRRRESNTRQILYERIALPLSYFGKYSNRYGKGVCLFALRRTSTVSYFGKKFRGGDGRDLHPLPSEPQSDRALHCVPPHPRNLGRQCDVGECACAS